MITKYNHRLETREIVMRKATTKGKEYTQSLPPNDTALASLKVTVSNTKNAKWDGKNDQCHYHYTVTGITKDDQEAFSFDFWGSLANFYDREWKLDALDMLDSFIGDCAVAVDHDSSASVMQEFSYDDPAEAKRIYKACKKSLKQWTQFLSEDDLYTLSDVIREAQE